MLAATARQTEPPSVGSISTWARAGGLLGYGFELRQVYRLAAEHVAHLLDGAAPAALPIQQPQQFYLHVNRATARALKLTLPRDVLAQATEVID